MELDAIDLSSATHDEVPAGDERPEGMDSGTDSHSQAFDSPIAQLKAELEAERQALAAQAERIREHEAESAGLRQTLAEAVARYRGLLLSSLPEVPQELVTGATIEELDTSVAAAQAVVAQIRQRLEANQSQERVPAGSPPRGAPDLAGLSPRDKIAYALTHGQR